MEVGWEREATETFRVVQSGEVEVDHRLLSSTAAWLNPFHSPSSAKSLFFCFVSFSPATPVALLQLPEG